MSDAGLDTDIILKSVCYGLAERLCAAVTSDGGRVHILGTAAFTARSRIARRASKREMAAAELDALIARAVVLEPTDEETALAAEVEAAAQALNVALDSGESQLASICAKRALHFLATGDKRAIIGFEVIVEVCEFLLVLRGGIICLEQMFLRLIGNGDAEDIRRRVCAEPLLDKALTICFQCSTPDASVDSWREGLRSYIEAVRRSAPTMLSSDS